MMSQEKNGKSTTNGSQASNALLGFSTRAVHVGQETSQWTSRAVVPPIVLSSTFASLSPGKNAGFYYSRCGNPTRESLERCLASLEKADYALVFSSGMATVATITQLFKAGDHILAADELYSGTNDYFRNDASKFSLTTSFVDFGNIEKLSAAIQSNTKLVWFETPTNPNLKVTDIEAVSKAVKAINAEVTIVVDNTFMGPYFQNPLSLGVDIVMNSCTKYINGHSDVIMGSIATNRVDLYEQLKSLQHRLGSVPSPFDCFLVNRGIKTLALRMERHQANALAVARFLETHPLVRKVIYLGLDSHPQREIIKRQCSGTGGMLSMYINGTLETTKKFIASLKVITLAASLGGVESLIEVPKFMSHCDLPAEMLETLGIDDTFMRLSIGVENVEDLIADLKQALDKVVNSK